MALRVAFAGTPDFARVALARLHSAGHHVVLVMCQPDRPAGRGMKLVAAPVKAFAIENGLPIAQPRGLRLGGRYAIDAAEARAALEAARPDVIVVAAYGLILPPWLLELPRHGCLNIHASLLPRWRGAAPVQRAIEAGDAMTGVTIMQMDAGLDTGAMLIVGETPIEPGDTASTLSARLAELGAGLAVSALARLDHGPLEGRAQPEAGITYAHKIEKREAAIDWHASAESIERRLRAFDPFPGSRSSVEGEIVTCWRGVARPGRGGVPGEVLGTGGALSVACGEGSLDLLELQRAGARRMPAPDFLRGRAPRVGAVFGNAETRDEEKG